MLSSAFASHQAGVGVERECLDARMGVAGVGGGEAEAHQHSALSQSCVSL